MNELDFLARLGEETPLTDAADLAPVLARVVDGITGHRRLPPRRAVMTGAIAAAAAAAAVAAVTLVPGHQAPGDIAGNVTATRLLDLAAAQALAHPAVVPEPGQFIYTRQVTSGRVIQRWSSVDGKHDGLMKVGGQAPIVIPGCPDSRTQGHVLPQPGGMVVECIPQPAFYPGMPTTASAMPRFLSREMHAELKDGSSVVRAAENLLQTGYVLPSQRAALYRFLATSPGFRVTQHVRDADGRPGIGLVWGVGPKIMLIFDLRTLAYVGGKSWSSDGQLGWSGALLQTAIVNRAAQQP